MPDNAGHIDPLYLFACHLEWLSRGDLAAYQELLAALDDTDGDVRIVAETLLQGLSRRPAQKESKVETW